MKPASSPSFVEYAGLLRRQIDEGLESLCEFPPGCPDVLREAIRYSLLGPGKRLRPLLVLLSAEACGCDPQEALPAACAVEMVHAYSLVHDDLPAMDDDDLRRGRPTCHKVYGEATAILVGDALLTRAFEVLGSRLRPPALAAECCAALAAAAGAGGMVGGQADDLDAQRLATARGPAEQLAVLESIHGRKTGAMLSVALKLGGLVGGASDMQQVALENYGRKLGLAFQIVDDLLDAAGAEAVAGKRVGKDARRGKLTFPGLLGLEASRSRVGQLVDEACAAVAPLAGPAAGLESLARYVAERDH